MRVVNDELAQNEVRMMTADQITFIIVSSSHEDSKCQDISLYYLKLYIKHF